MLTVFAVIASIAAGIQPASALSAQATPFPYVTPTALAGSAAVASPTPTPVPAPIVRTLNGVTLGDSRAATSKSLGRPAQEVPVNVGEMWTWNTDGGKAIVAVVFSQDAVLSITLSPKNGKKSGLQDPYGVTLGMTVDQLTSLRGQPLTVADNGNRVYGDLGGVRWVYGVDSGVITDIDLAEPPQSVATPAPATLDTSGGRDGSNASKAVVVKASSASAGIALELAYIKGLSCGQGGSWNIVTQTTEAVGEKWYDAFDVVCSADKTTYVLYFDVSSYGGT